MCSSVPWGPGSRPESEASPPAVEREEANIREGGRAPWHQPETSSWVPLKRCTRTGKEGYVCQCWTCH